MKQLLFLVALILAMALNAGAKPGKNKDLIKHLLIAMKGSQVNTVVKKDLYSKVLFLFKNKIVSAFYDAESEEPIGFSVPVSISDLAQETVQKMQNKLQKYSFQEAILFIKKDGVPEFYVSMSRPQKPTVILTISAKGKPYHFGKQ